MNPRPAVYKTAALPTELRQLNQGGPHARAPYAYILSGLCSQEAWWWPQVVIENLEPVSFLTRAVIARSKKRRRSAAGSKIRRAAPWFFLETERLTMPTAAAVESATTTAAVESTTASTGVAGKSATATAVEAPTTKAVR